MFVDKETFYCILEVIKGVCVPIFGVIGPAVLDLLTRTSYGPLKIIFFTNCLFLSFTFIYAYIQVQKNMYSIYHLIADDGDDQSEL